MVILSDDKSIPWISLEEVISLGSPSGSALSSMCVALSVVIEYFNHTEEQYDQNIGRLTLTHEVTMSISQSVSDANMPGMQDQLYKSNSGAGSE